MKEKPEKKFFGINYFEAMVPVIFVIFFIILAIDIIILKISGQDISMEEFIGCFSIKCFLILALFFIFLRLGKKKNLYLVISALLMGGLVALGNYIQYIMLGQADLIFILQESLSQCTGVILFVIIFIACDLKWKYDRS